MNDVWSAPLEQQGIHPSAPAQRLDPATTWVAPLAQHRLLRLQGPDAGSFLQGQVTCDLNELSAEQSLVGANCTPKGNVISAFRVLHKAPDELFLRLNAAIAEPALANLRKYSVFSKVEITDLADNYLGIGLAGPDAERLLRGQLAADALPSTLNGQAVCGDAVVVCVDAEQPRFELWLPQAAAVEAWAALCQHAAASAPAQWLAAEIAAGLVLLDEASVDTYLPQMLNLQAVAGISFRKGCYIGQEVVARLQHRGKLKKVLYAARVEGAEAAPGDTLHSPDRSSVGKVLAVVGFDDGSQLLQAVINKGEADRDQLRLHTSEGAAVTLQALPYAIDPALFERG